MDNRPVLVMMVMLAAAGCDRNEQPATAESAAVRAPQAAGDVVAAVQQSTGTPVARLGFALLSKPAAGVESAMRLDLSSDAEVPALLLVAEASGLDLDAPSATASVALEADDRKASHELRFTPQQPGLTEVTVRLRSAEAESAETVYVIPVLVEGAAGS